VPEGSDAVAGFWVGLDGFTSPTVEQIGTEADCEGHKPVYFAWSELYPHRLVALPTEADPVRPGDLMHAQVTRAALRLEDATEGWKAVVPIRSSGFQYSSAEWIVEAPSMRMTGFGRVAFTSASAGDSEGAEQPIDSGLWSVRRLSVLSGSPRQATAQAVASGLFDHEGRSSFEVVAPQR
jgi:hypothetical protein